MKIYIAGSYAIAPNFSVEKGVDFTLSNPADKDYFQAIEPDYKTIIDPKVSRRMARVIKMSVAAATKSLAPAKIANPGAIIVGTGLGCLQDTEKFLADVIENNENLPSPTAFIQSTHNTIAGQIALLLNCYAHNFTFVQRAHSFESALGDAMLQIEEGVDNVLLGGVDEITPSLFKILSHANCVSKLSERSNTKISSDQKPVLGEGASFFVLSGQQTHAAKACIVGLDCFYKTDNVESIESRIKQFLKSMNMNVADVSAIMVGKNGYQKEDKIFDSITKNLFPDQMILTFKNICGEYFTATSFGLYLTAEILHSQKIDDAVFASGRRKENIENILLYNHYKGNYHTLMLLSRCRPL